MFVCLSVSARICVQSSLYAYVPACKNTTPLSCCRPQRRGAVLLKRRPVLAFLALCGAGTALLLWTQAYLLSPRWSARLQDPPFRSEAGTPCLMTRLYGIDCQQLTAANLTYLEAMAAKQDWKV